MSHLVIYQILLHYKDLKKNNLNEDENVHPLMDIKLSTIGISYDGHKKVDNIIQILYIRNVSNALD